MLWFMMKDRAVRLYMLLEEVKAAGEVLVDTQGNC